MGVCFARVEPLHIAEEREMFWVTKVLIPALLVLGAGTAVVMAEADGNQPPFGRFQPGKGDDKKPEDRKKDDKKVEEKKGQPGDRKGQPGSEKGQPGDKRGPGPKPDATVDAWVKTLIEKITDPHDTVRESARGALVGVGPAALPALQRLAEGDDSAKAIAARKLINAITRGGPQGGPGQPGQPGGNRPGGGGGPGGPGMGPMGGPGFPGPGGMGPMGPGGGFPGGQPGMNPGGGGRGGFPGGQPGMNPGGGGRGGFGGFGGWRGGREASDIEVAPMPRNAR